LFDIAICEKDSSQVDFLEKSIVKHLFDEELNIDIYESGEELIEAYAANKCRYDLVILGTDLKTVTGFEVASALRERDASAEIVFVSDDSQGVFRSFEYRAFDFFVKPVSEERFSEMLERYKFYHSDRTEEYFSYKVSGVENRVKIKSIVYFCSNGRKIGIVTPNNSFEFYAKLDEVEKVVENPQFIRVHQSYYVNSRYIKYLLRNDIVLDNGEYVPISRNRIKAVREEYLKLLSEA